MSFDRPLKFWFTPEGAAAYEAHLHAFYSRLFANGIVLDERVHVSEKLRFAIPVCVVSGIPFPETELLITRGVSVPILKNPYSGYVRQEFCMVAPKGVGSKAVPTLVECAERMLALGQPLKEHTVIRAEELAHPLVGTRSVFDLICLDQVWLGEEQAEFDSGIPTLVVELIWMTPEERDSAERDWDTFIKSSEAQGLDFLDFSR